MPERPLRHRIAPSARPGPGHERGESLIEVLASISLMGIGMLVIITALLTITQNAEINKQRTQVGAFLQKWGDAVAAPRFSSMGVTTSTQNYNDCTIPSADANSVGVPAGVKAQWKVQYLVSAAPPAQPNWASPTWGLIRDDVSNTGDGGTACFAQGDRGLMKVTLYATSTGKHPVSDSVVLYRRRSECPGSFSSADRGPC